MARHTLDTLLGTADLIERFNYNIDCIRRLQGSPNLMRVPFSDLHLLMEIATRKYLLANNIDVSVSTHKLSGIVSKIHHVDVGFFDSLVRNKIHSKFTLWDYNDLRFSNKPSYYSPTYNELNYYLVSNKIL